MGFHTCYRDCGCSRARCKTCLDLDWNLYPESSQHPPDNRTIVTDFRSITESADRGCETCFILQKGIVTFGERLLEEAPQCGGDWQSSLVLIGLRRGHALTLCMFGSLEYACELILWLEFYTHFGSETPWPAFGPAEDIPAILDLDACTRFARKWIDNCETSHVESCHRQLPRLPKRVLDLGTDEVPSTLKLKETKEETGWYTTLSHRWGDPRYALLTTKANISNFLLGIPWSPLPKTVKDAVLITRRLGIRYLWIDSLCIIQDDDQDWDLESAKMAAIYSSSYLTIAATHAADGREGCFSTRWTTGNSPPGLPGLPQMSTKAIEILVNLGIEGREDKVLVRPGHHLAHEDTSSLKLVSKNISPLLTRAWVLQELLLSTRILHLHAEEMVWECRGCSGCECSFLDPPNLPNESVDGAANPMYNDDVQLDPVKAAAYRSLLKSHIHVLFAQLCGGDRNLGMQKTTWFTIIQQYVRLGLTKETDRLIALSGLASAVSMHRDPDDSYLAGMWKKDLAHSLFWEVRWAHKCRITRAPEPRPPTWSWASVQFGGPPAYSNYIDLSLGSALNPPPDVEFRFRDIKAWCEAENENLFGRVAGGVLTVTGPFVVAKASYDDYEDNSGLSARIILDFRGDKELVVSDVSPMEALTTAELEKDVTCLLMGRDKNAISGESFCSGFTITEWNICMVLKESAREHGKYERIGLLHNQKDRSWFGDAMEKTFEVV